MNDGFGIDGTKLTVTPPTGTTVIGDTLTARLGEKYVKTYLINSVPVVFAGEGTASDPYRIENNADWKKLADFVEATGWEYMNSHFIVTSDIDFAGDSIRPMAFAGVRFQSNLNGNGKTLRGFVYDNPNGFANRIDPNNPNKFVAKGTGLFGSIGNAGTVQIVSTNALVENCFNRGSVGHRAKGGVAGIAYTCMGTMRGCVNEKTLVGPGNLYGVVYAISANGILEDCGNTAEFNCPDGANIFGVFNSAAEGGSGYLKGLYNTGDITSAYLKASGSTILGCTSPQGLRRLFALTVNENFHDGVDQSVTVREI